MSHENILGGHLDSVWREAFHRVLETELMEKVSVDRVNGKHKTYVPASSVATVYVKVHKRPTGIDIWTLFVLGHGSLPGGSVPALVPPYSKVLPVLVVNFSAEDVWLLLRLRWVCLPVVVRGK